MLGKGFVEVVERELVLGAVVKLQRSPHEAEINANELPHLECLTTAQPPSHRGWRATADLDKVDLQGQRGATERLAAVGEDVGASMDGILKP